MFCPYCGTKNDDGVAICINAECKRVLPQGVVPAAAPRAKGSRSVAVQPADPLASALNLGSFSGMIGGGMALLGWFLPWVSLSLGPFPVAAGNGPQILMGLLGAGFVGGALGGLADNSSFGILALCLTLAFAGLVLIVPVFGFLAALDGWRLFTDRSDGGKLSRNIALARLGEIRSRMLRVLIIMAISFVVASIVSLGALGPGFWLAGIGSLGGFLGSVYAQSQLRNRPG